VSRCQYTGDTMSVLWRTPQYKLSEDFCDSSRSLLRTTRPAMRGRLKGAHSAAWSSWNKIPLTYYDSRDGELSALDSRAPGLRPPLQCWEVRPSSAGHSPTIKRSDAATRAGGHRAQPHKEACARCGVAGNEHVRTSAVASGVARRDVLGRLVVKDELGRLLGRHAVVLPARSVT
jgi:hypothetical protein